MLQRNKDGKVRISLESSNPGLFGCPRANAAPTWRTQGDTGVQSLGIDRSTGTVRSALRRCNTTPSRRITVVGAKRAFGSRSGGKACAFHRTSPPFFLGAPSLQHRYLICGRHSGQAYMDRSVINNRYQYDVDAAGWERSGLHDLTQVSGVGSVRYTYILHNTRYIPSI